MPELVETLRTYVPHLVARHLADHPDPLTEPLDIRFKGAVFFADISGFTKIAEQLASHGLSGAEELTNHLNEYFGQMIGIIASHGGDIVKFAGDALYAVWYNDKQDVAQATLRATQCGLDLRNKLNEYDVSDDIDLYIRVAIGAGNIQGVAVGGVLRRWEFLIAGPPLKQVGAAIDVATAGQVLISEQAQAILQDKVSGDLTVSGEMIVETVNQHIPPRPMPQVDLSDEAVDGLKGFISGAILDRLDQVQAGWLAEHRRLTVMFLQVTNLDFEAPDAVIQLHNIMQAMQVGLYNYEGSVRQLIEDDKGTVFIGAYGLPPFTHQDDSLRGVQSALAMRAKLEDMGYKTRIGITSGHVFCGPVGNTLRREYTLVGNVVNMAARLMGATKKHGVGILCDEATYQAASSRLAFRDLPAIKLKNIAEPVVTYTPYGEAQVESSLRPIVGRQRERNQLTAHLRELRQGTSNVVYIEGVAGIGKTRLVEDLIEQAEAMDVVHYLGKATTVDKTTPYYVWNDVLRKIFDVGMDARTTVRRKTIVTQILKDRDMMKYLPLLNTALSLDLPENDFTTELTGSMRIRSTRDLMLNILRAVVERGPMVIVLENAQWMDGPSWEFTLTVSQEIRPLLLVVAGRPIRLDGTSDIEQLVSKTLVEKITLEPLALEGTQSLVRHYLDVASIDVNIVDLIHKQSQGNPFFSEELALALREAGTIKEIDGSYVLNREGNEDRQFVLPETLQGVITSRIDRLNARLQLTLKVASVIGTTFSYHTLYDIYPIEPYKDQLKEHLATLQDFDLIEPVRSSTEQHMYQFKQSLTQEVTYNLIPFMQRHQLHEAVAHWYERNFVYDLSPYYSFLAHHWQQADNHAAAMKYLEKAGEQSLRNGAFQDAVDFFRQALVLAASSNLSQGTAYRLARWERSLADAYWGLGYLEPAIEHVKKCLIWMQDPVPEDRRQLLRASFHAIKEQALHRLFTNRYMGHARSAEEVPFPVNEGAYAYRLLSELYYSKNKIMLSFYAGAKAVNLAETAGERHPVLARAYANAYVGLSTTRRNWASRIYKRLALTTSEKVNKPYVTAPVLVRLGMYDVVRGQWTSARSLIEQSITLYDKMNDKRGWNEAQYLLGFLTYIKGDFGNGADRFDDLAISAQLIGNTGHRVVGLSGYAMNLLALGKTRLAVVQLEQAKPLWEHPHLEPAALLYSQSVYALAAARQGEIERATSVAADALEKLDNAFHPSVMASPFGALLLAQVYVELAKDNDAAAQYVDKALERILVALNRLGKTFAVVKPYLELYRGYVAHFAGRDSRARRHWQAALITGREMAIPYVEGMAHFILFQQAEVDSSDWNTHQAGASRIFEELSAEYYLEQLKKR